MPVSKNPFSLYDFLGYFVPGAFMLSSLLVASNENKELVRVIGDIDVGVFSKIYNLKMDSFSVPFFAIVAYILGHFLSYVSSITIELLSNRVFQYPSKYLLNVSREKYNKKRESLSGVCALFFQSDTWYGSVLLVVAFVMNFPVTVPMAIFAYCKSISNYLTRKLDDNLVAAIKTRMLNYACVVGDYSSPDCAYCDNHLIIMHYVNINVPNASRKVDNYVALYGFLRSMSLAFSILFVMALGSSISTINTEAIVDWHIICTLCVLSIAPSVSYLAYLKFYRRHTLENLMAFLVAPDPYVQIKEGVPSENSEKNEKKHFSVGFSLFARRE